MLFSLTGDESKGDEGASTLECKAEIFSEVGIGLGRNVSICVFLGFKNKRVFVESNAGSRPKAWAVGGLEGGADMI